MLNNPVHYVQGRSSRLRDLAGFGFFLFAALISAMSAWQHPSILTWLYAIHNGLLAFFYARRAPAKQYDRTGLWLGMIAAFLPTFTTTTSHTAWYFLFPALAGYVLILWSLITLGPRFGVAPADRGLTSRGPYRLLRHPMYLGRTGVSGGHGFQFTTALSCDHSVTGTGVHSMLANPTGRENDRRIHLLYAHCPLAAYSWTLVKNGKKPI